MKACRLAIVGSVSFADPMAEMGARRMIRAAISHYQPSVVISGGAEGVDTWAREEAEAAGYTVENGRMVEHLPERKQWEPNGYKARNQQIAEDCTHLLAIRCPQASSYGSGWTADTAQKIGRKVHRRYLAALTGLDVA